MNKQWTRQSLLLLAGLTAAMSASAHDAMLFKGFYVNLSAGALQSLGKMDHSDSAQFQYTDDFLGLAHDQVARQWKTTGVAALALGYGDFVSDDFHLSGEIFVNYAKRHLQEDDGSLFLTPNSPANFVSLDSVYSSNLRKWEYGVDVKPGFLYNPCSLIYGRIGVAFNEHTVDANTGLSLFNAVAGAADTFTSSSSEKTRAALRLGLGIEHAMTTCLSVTADYIWTHYGSVSTGSVTDALGFGVGDPIPAVITANGLSSAATARMDTQVAMLGLKWTFH